jgi:hypothetical protein
MAPRNMSLVKFNEGGVYPAPPRHSPDIRKQYPFVVDEAVLFIGEIVNMPGHCVVVRKDGKVLWGYGTDKFIELTEDEL